MLQKAGEEQIIMMYSARESILTVSSDMFRFPLATDCSTRCVHSGSSRVYSDRLTDSDSIGSHLLTTDHDLHRKRRKPLEPFFSRMGITRLQPMLAEVAFHLEQRLRALKGQNKVIRLDHAFSAFSGDIIGRICLDSGESESSSFLDDDQFAPDWYELA